MSVIVFVVGNQERLYRGVFQHGLDAVNMRLGNFGNIIGPVFPVVAVSAFFHNLRIERTLDIAHFVNEVQLLGLWCVRILGANAVASTGLCGSSRPLADGQRLRSLLHLVRNGDDFHFGSVGPLQVQLVHHGVEAVIVRSQRLQYLPDHCVGLVVVQCFMGLYTGRNHYGQHHIAQFFARGVAHHASYGLHHIHL